MFAVVVLSAKHCIWNLQLL